MRPIQAQRVHQKGKLEITLPCFWDYFCGIHEETNVFAEEVTKF